MTDVQKEAEATGYDYIREAGKILEIIRAGKFHDYQQGIIRAALEAAEQRGREMAI